MDLVLMLKILFTKGFDAKEMQFFLRILALLTILSFLIIETNYILTPKKYFDNDWSTTSTYKGFYQMKTDSVDVLFLGSSHVADGFNPQEIYEIFRKYT